MARRQSPRQFSPSQLPVRVAASSRAAALRTMIAQPPRTSAPAMKGRKGRPGTSANRASRTATVASAVGGSEQKRTKRTYEVELEIERHRPVIRHMSTYEGEPHTADQAAFIGDNARTLFDLPKGRPTK